MAAVLLLLLLAPTGAREWSKAHKVGLILPSTWKIVARDQGDRAFVVHGPRLGPGTPTAVLWHAGGAARLSLEKKADELERAVTRREGWRVVARKRKRLGAYSAIRLGFSFVEGGDRKGRARFTVLLMGGSFYVLELNAAASHFPGPTFDRIEKSLAIPWRGQNHPAGFELKTPRGWLWETDGVRASIYGPALGLGPTILRMGPGRVPEAMLAGAKPGPKVGFLGERCETRVVERKIEKDLRVRMLHVHAHGISATAMIPVAVWEDTFPTVEAILASVERPARDPLK